MTSRITTRRRLTSRVLMAGGLILSAAALPVQAAVPSGGPAKLVADVERYLNGLGTFKARFTQIAPNGAKSEGEVYVKRPGQLRFDYDPPSKVLLIAPGDWRLIFYDGSVKQVNVLPISRTPLGILLDDPVRLGGEIEVTGIAEQGDEVAIRVVRRAAPDQGSVTLVLRKEPLELRRWSVVDPQGLETHVVLEGFETNVALNSTLFRWRDPKIFGWPDE